MAPCYRNTRTLTLVRTLCRAVQRVENNVAHIIAESGLSGSEFDAVMALGNREFVRMGDLATSMLTSAPNITRIVKLLEGKGLAERVRNPECDRETLARLTPEGVAVLKPSIPRFTKARKPPSTPA